MKVHEENQLHFMWQPSTYGQTDRPSHSFTQPYKYSVIDSIFTLSYCILKIIGFITLKELGPSDRAVLLWGMSRDGRAGSPRLLSSALLGAVGSLPSRSPWSVSLLSDSLRLLPALCCSLWPVWRTCSDTSLRWEVKFPCGSATLHTLIGYSIVFSRRELLILFQSVK